MTETLRISRTSFPVTALGPGTRLGVWVQGCPLACKGCMSLDTWDRAGGVEVAVDDLLSEWEEAVANGATGLTVSGGEPLEQAPAIAAFLRRVHEIRDADHDILMYTGYELGELGDDQLAAAAYADVLVTGRYVAAAPTGLIWRGSANQTMVLRTDLARRRYAEYLDHVPDQPPIQLRVDDDGVWIVGVPRQGTLQRLERQLRATGMPVDQVSWRLSVSFPVAGGRPAGMGGDS